LIRDARRLLLAGVKVAEVAQQLGVSYPTLHGGSSASPV